MENKDFKIYSVTEELLINYLKRHQEREDALKTKKKTADLLALDQLLLDMEAQQDMLDGIKGEEWLV